ncbi:MAG: hypothetical protein ACK4WB_03610 [Desulfatiglandales bacterium]
MEEGVIWYGFYKGELCRMRLTPKGGVVCEVWRRWSWVKGPDFSRLGFTGMPLDEGTAHSWIRKRFREKRVDYCKEF